MIEICPKCKSADNVIPKAIMIGAKSPKAIFGNEEPCGYFRKDQVAVDECKEEKLKPEPLKQFVDGFYCERCGTGFLSDDVLADKERQRLIDGIK